MFRKWQNNFISKDRLKCLIPFLLIKHLRLMSIVYVDYLHDIFDNEMVQSDCCKHGIIANVSLYLT